MATNCGGDHLTRECPEVGGGKGGGKHGGVGVCYDFRDNGSCRFGDECSFSRTVFEPAPTSCRVSVVGALHLIMPWAGRFTPPPLSLYTPAFLSHATRRRAIGAARRSDDDDDLRSRRSRGATCSTGFASQSHWADSYSTSNGTGRTERQQLRHPGTRYPHAVHHRPHRTRRATFCARRRAN